MFTPRRECILLSSPRNLMKKLLTHVTDDGDYYYNTI